MGSVTLLIQFTICNNRRCNLQQDTLGHEIEHNIEFSELTGTRLGPIAIKYIVRYAKILQYAWIHFTTYNEEFLASLSSANSEYIFISTVLVHRAFIFRLWMQQ